MTDPQYDRGVIAQANALSAAQRKALDLLSVGPVPATSRDGGIRRSIGHNLIARGLADYQVDLLNFIITERGKLVLECAQAIDAGELVPPPAEKRCAMPAVLPRSPASLVPELSIYALAVLHYCYVFGYSGINSANLTEYEGHILTTLVVLGLLEHAEGLNSLRESWVITDLGERVARAAGLIFSAELV